MKKIILVILCVIAIPVMASHIVGGEFEIVYVSGNTYRVNLIIYFDELHGEDGARDASVLARIYRKRDHALMMDVFLPQLREDAVEYTQPECSKGEIVTSKITYSNTITLANDRFNDPQGYYIVWERCCRNYSITNIVSNQPPVGVTNAPDAAGQTFYLEFPPVIKNGQPFINSSPRLFPPLNDYACPGKPYYADFAGVDNDDDSLVYTITTPLNTHTSEALPPLGPHPAPYPLVLWQTGFSINNIMSGNPDLKISRDGLLTVTPQRSGLFVFAVRCEEFRDGLKIGELRRDFQMLVVSGCPKASPPQIVGKRLKDDAFTFDGTMQVTFPNTIQDADRCIRVQVSDPDALSVDDNFEEKVKIKAIPLGFKKNVSSILPRITSAVLKNGNTVEFEICFDKCPYTSGPFQIGIVAYDDACSLPLFDTLKVMVNIEPPFNNPATFTSANVTADVVEGTPDVAWVINGADLDNDKLTLTPYSPDARFMADYGFTLTPVKDQAGLIEYKLSLNSKCDEISFNKKSIFHLEFLLDDADECLLQKPDTMVLDVKVILPDNDIPTIDTNLTPEAYETSVSITKRVNETLLFNVFGTDADVDNVILLAVQSEGFNMGDYAMTFPPVSGYGNVVSLFKWDIKCDEVNLNNKDEYVFNFLVTENINRCNTNGADTVKVKVKLEPPANEGPVISITNLNDELTMSNEHLSATLGQQITLGLVGIDKDKSPIDKLTLELIGATGNVTPSGYSFAEVEGLGTVESIFTWNPACNIFENGIYANDYTFTFLVTDNRCFNTKRDSIDINISIKDIEHKQGEFMPPNFISPNGDGVNDFFAMLKTDEHTGELINILPQDNCTGRFEGIIIYNRWGGKVFDSPHRDFRWYATSNPSGVYYYTLKYSDREYKGIITVSKGESQSNR